MFLDNPNDITLGDEEEGALDESLLACTVGGARMGAVSAGGNVGISGNQHGQVSAMGASFTLVAVNRSDNDSLLAQILLQQQRNQAEAISSLTERFL